ncbi:MAG TPA: cytochrome b/b6 domain-containing protein [Dehalococcoidia bacterium]|nr:cytochrome b/b6 domain-containing protein [Dehalococcoidia bacterium]
MSARQERIPGAAPRPSTRWLPALLLLLTVVGAVLVLPMVTHDQGARSWYRGLLGGSGLYRLDVAFARLAPFILAAGVCLALIVRGRGRRHVLVVGTSLRRHEWSEVVTHWANAAGIGIGLITAAWLKRWIGRPFSLETTYLLHFIGAGLTLAAVAYHLTFELAGGGAGLVPRRLADVKNALAEVISYTGVYRGLRGAFGVQLPPVIRRPLQKPLRALKLAPDPPGKYLATEKVLSYTIWTVLIAIIVLTGLVKSLHYVFAMPAGLRQAATFLHDGATLFILAFLCIHVAALVLVPRNWPLVGSMFTTRVPRAYAKHHLPGWEAEAEREEDARGASRIL